MPLYEYSCENCGETFEELISLRDRDSQRVCPTCGSEQVQRLISAFAVGKSSAKAAASAVSCPTCSTGVCDLG